MPENVTKKQIIQHLKTPYAKLEIGGENFAETYEYQPGQRRKTKYEHLVIKANPLATAWRINRIQFPSSMTLLGFSQIITIASEYIEDNWLTWGDWEMSQGAEQYPKCKRSKSWGDMKPLLKATTRYCLFYKDMEDEDASFHIYHFNPDVWEVHTGKKNKPVDLYRLKDVMTKIRTFSDIYSLSASDWCYEV